MGVCLVKGLLKKFVEVGSFRFLSNSLNYICVHAVYIANKLDYNFYSDLQ